MESSTVATTVKTTASTTVQTTAETVQTVQDTPPDYVQYGDSAINGIIIIVFFLGAILGHFVYQAFNFYKW